MKLIIKSKPLASVYGLPMVDCEYDDAVKSLGWQDEQGARAHVDAAIAAGAYAVATDEVKPKPRTKKGEEA